MFCESFGINFHYTEKNPGIRRNFHYTENFIDKAKIFQYNENINRKGVKKWLLVKLIWSD